MGNVGRSAESQPHPSPGSESLAPGRRRGNLWAFWVGASLQVERSVWTEGLCPFFAESREYCLAQSG